MIKQIILTVSFLVIGAACFAESDADLSRQVVGHWGKGRTDLYLYSTHKAKSSNFKAPGQDKLGTWSIENGYLTISFWPQVRGKVSFRDLGNVHSLVLTSDDGGRDLWDRFPMK
jgi:hypothetical protein